MHTVEINAAFLYLNVFEKFQFLDAEIMEPDEDAYQFYTGGQLSGTCAQRSIHQMLKCRFKSVDDYRKFIFSFKDYALDKYIKTLKKHNQLGDSQYQPQVDKAIRHLLRLVNVNQTQTDIPLFSSDFRQRYRKKLTDYLLELKKTFKAAVIKTDSKKKTDKSLFIIINNTSSSIPDSSISAAIPSLVLTDPTPKQLNGRTLFNKMRQLQKDCESFKYQW